MPNESPARAGGALLAAAAVFVVADTWLGMVSGTLARMVAGTPNRAARLRARAP